MTERARSGALAVTALCGAASVVCMFMVGRGQKSLLLIAMFTVWVVSPFAASLYVQRRVPQRAAIAWIGTVASLISATIYASVAFGPPRPQPAKFFLLVPAAMWVLFGAAWLVGLSRKQ